MRHVFMFSDFLVSAFPVDSRLKDFQNDVQTEGLEDKRTSRRISRRVSGRISSQKDFLT